MIAQFFWRAVIAITLCAAIIIVSALLHASTWDVAGWCGWASGAVTFGWWPR